VTVYNWEIAGQAAVCTARPAHKYVRGDWATPAQAERQIHAEALSGRPLFVDADCWEEIATTTVSGSASNVEVLGRCLWPQMVYFFRNLCRLAQHHATKHSDAKNIEPSIVEIEQVRMGYRRDNIFAHCQ
jgi:hypothetical protein